MSDRSESSCRQTDSAAAFVEGTLSSSASAAYESHVAVCADCLLELNLQKRISNLVKGSLDLRNAPDLPADFSRRVSIVAEGQVSGLRDKGERRRFVALLALASAGAAVFAAAQSEALVRASGSFSVKVFGLIPIAVSFVQNLSLGCFGVLRTVCNRILGDASSTLPMLFTLFVAAVLAFLVIASARRGPGGDEL